MTQTQRATGASLVVKTSKLLQEESENRLTASAAQSSMPKRPPNSSILFANKMFKIRLLQCRPWYCVASLLFDLGIRSDEAAQNELAVPSVG
jgi:hypothetical protein